MKSFDDFLKEKINEGELDGIFSLPGDKPDLTQTKPLPGEPVKFGARAGREKDYTGQTANSYNNVVTSIKTLMERQPQLRNQLNSLLQSFRQIFKQIAQHPQPQVGRRAASPAIGANPATPEISGDEYGRRMQARYDGSVIHQGKTLRG